jgi:predicted ATPase
MSRALDRITVQGFKSIRDLKEFPLHKLNVLIGPNGAGKSNLIDFFRMLRAMSDGGLRAFVTASGGGDTFFFNGPKATQQIFVQLAFGQNAMRFSLAPTADNEIMVKSQGTFWGGGKSPAWKEHGGGGKESSLKEWKNHQSTYGPYLSVQGCIHEAVSGWVVYHVHDTSSTAAMRREPSPHDYRELRPDASNLAAFLARLQQAHTSRYQRIRETVQIIAPFFDDFLLEPEKRGENDVIRLQWRQKGSSFPFQPWQFSDGTIRFICLATALLQPSPPSTIVVDEPELGLHPFALEVLAGLVHETAQRAQLVISTQSAPLLDHFEPEHVIVVDRVDNASSFRRLERDQLEQWLADYSMGELLRKNIVEAGPLHA